MMYGFVQFSTFQNWWISLCPRTLFHDINRKNQIKMGRNVVFLFVKVSLRIHSVCKCKREVANFTSIQLVTRLNLSRQLEATWPCFSLNLPSLFFPFSFCHFPLWGVSPRSRSFFTHFPIPCQVQIPWAAIKISFFVFPWQRDFRFMAADWFSPGFLYPFLFKERISFFSRSS